MITREWVLEYCHQNHRLRSRGLKDAPFHQGAALFDGERYLVKWAPLKAGARAAGWSGSAAEFAKALRAVGMVSRQNTTVAKRQCRPWVLELTEQEKQTVECEPCG
ncbi:hypothetical protein [Ruegeria sp.]|uniref:hypothetical protein n=1 Tax=Ruegeria sp. TaxID=1879320 RepID=UPI003B5B093B